MVAPWNSRPLRFHATSDFGLNRDRLERLFAANPPGGEIRVRLTIDNKARVREGTWRAEEDLFRVIEQIAEFIRSDWQVTVIHEVRLTEQPRI